MTADFSMVGQTERPILGIVGVGYVGLTTGACLAQPDISRARELLGWEPQVALRDGLRLMVDSLEQTTASKL